MYRTSKDIKYCLVDEKKKKIDPPGRKQANNIEISSRGRISYFVGLFVHIYEILIASGVIRVDKKKWKSRSFFEF